MSVRNSCDVRREKIAAGEVIRNREMPEEVLEHIGTNWSRDQTQTDNEPAGPQFSEGHSIAWYAGHPINPEDILLGDRYLCRGGGMFIVAPSGMGKSTLSIQIAVLWCCGLLAFGIKPRKALRILIVQSEDDEGDCTEMAQMIKHLSLTDAQEKRVWENSELIRCNNLVSFKFICALRARLEKAVDDKTPFDLVLINPYGVYLGADVKDTEACMKFPQRMAKSHSHGV